MQLRRDDIIALADAIVKAVRDCEAILVASIETAEQSAPAVRLEPQDAVLRPIPELLTRAAAADYLRDVVGYPVSKPTLAKLAVTGGGPPFQSFGRRVVYEPAELRAWAKGRSRRRRNTSDRGAPV